MVPVGDLLKQKAVLLREAFSSEEIREAYQAWNFIDRALQSEADTSILKRCKPPREAFDHLEKRYDPESEVATQKLYMTSSMTSPYPPTATPLRHCMR